MSAFQHSAIRKRLKDARTSRFAFIGFGLLIRGRGGATARPRNALGASGVGPHRLDDEGGHSPDGRLEDGLPTLSNGA